MYLKIIPVRTFEFVLVEATLGFHHPTSYESRLVTRESRPCRRAPWPWNAPGAWRPPELWQRVELDHRSKGSGQAVFVNVWRPWRNRPGVVKFIQKRKHEVVELRCFFSKTMIEKRCVGEADGYMAVNLDDLGLYVIFGDIRGVLLAQYISCISLPAVFFWTDTQDIPRHWLVVWGWFGVKLDVGLTTMMDFWFASYCSMAWKSGHHQLRDRKPVCLHRGLSKLQWIDFCSIDACAFLLNRSPCSNHPEMRHEVMAPSLETYTQNLEDRRLAPPIGLSTNRLLPCIPL